MTDADFPSLMLPVAEAFWGDPNKKLSGEKQKRWGNFGSKVVYLDKGTWYDFDADIGGGVFSLIQHELGLAEDDKAGAIGWLEENGYIDKREPSRERNPENRQAQRDERPEPPPPGEDKPVGKWTIVETYDYENGDGDLLYQVCRIQWKLPDGTWRLGKKGKADKTFVQRRPSRLGDNSWVWSLSAGEFMRRGPGEDWRSFDRAKFDDFPATRERRAFKDEVPHGLYRLQKIEQAIERGETIFILEGEKKCNLAAGIGLEATCNSGGARKFHDDLLSAFKGAHVVILPDNDPSGIAHAEMVAGKLRKIAASVKLVILPGLPEKGDIEEWLNAGGTKDKLVELANAAPEFQPRPPATSFNAFRISDLGQARLRHEWLVDGIVELMGTTALIGPSLSGKSFQVIDLCFSIALGRPWWGHEVKQGLVVYQMGEGEQGVAKRVEGYLKYHDLESRADLPIVFLPKKINLFVDDKDTDALIAELKQWEAFHGQKLRLLVIDTLNKAITGASEISGQDMGKVIARMERIKDELKCTILVVHHMNATGSRIRGHSSLIADLTNVIEVKPLEITDQNGRTVRTMRLEKNKDGEGNKVHRFVLRQVMLEPFEDGKPRTTCVVDVPAGEDDASAKGYSLTDHEKVVYQALVDAVNEFGQVPPRSVPPGISRVVLRPYWVQQVRKVWSFKEIASDTPEEAKARQNEELAALMKRVSISLFNAGIIGRDNDNDIVWLTGKRVKGKVRETERAMRPQPELPKPDIAPGVLNEAEGLPF